MSRLCGCARAASARARRTLVLFAQALAAFGFFPALACQKQAPDSAAAPLATQNEPAGTAGPRVVQAAPAPAQHVTFRAEGAPAFAVSTDLIDLKDDARLSQREFEARVVRTQSPQALEACKSGSLLLVLDDQSPRPLLEPAVPLQSLVDEDRELSPGWHVLVAFVRLPEVTTLQVARFQLDSGVPEPPTDSQCALLEPVGTVALPAGGSIRLLAAPLAAEAKQFEYFLRREPPATFRTHTLEAVRVLGLAAGDHRIGVRCFDAAGMLVGESERTVTANLDQEFGQR